jgi:chemotaxis protein methyltransferase WspC
VTTLAALLHRLESRAGLDVSATQAGAIEKLTSTRQRELGLAAVENYLTRIGDLECSEFQRVIQLATVPYTWFFRDREQLLGVRECLAAPGRRVRVWVPGCATGEDVYSVALMARACGVQAEVLGTDVNAEALRRARVGRYARVALRELPPEFASSFRSCEHSMQLDQSLFPEVRFELHSVVDEPPLCGNGRVWDLIVCRNVLIYFKPDAARRALARLTQALAPGATLFLGASDVLHEIPAGLSSVLSAGRIAFRRANVPASTKPLPVGRAALPRQHSTVVAQCSPAPGDLECGHAELSRGNLEAALQAYARACEADPPAAEAYLYSGVVHYTRRDFISAQAAFRAALFHDPELAPAAFYLGLCHETNGMLPDARREYELVTKIAARRDRGAQAAGPLAAWQRDLALSAAERLRRTRAR